MKVGTKSLLFGAHAFWLHPFFVAAAWVRLYGFRSVEDPFLDRISIWNPWLWVVFFIHDWGYWGCDNMDGPEGERHPEWAAERLLRWHPLRPYRWYAFCKYHSRFLSKRSGVSYSMLCPVDKLAVALEPWWLYLPRVMLTGEHREYMRLADRGKYEAMNIGTTSVRKWHRDMTDYCARWAYEHRESKRDTWTEVAP